MAVDGERPWQRLVITLASVALMTWAVWMEAPEWQREQLKRTVKARAYLVLHRLARASGHRAMGAELAGRPEADAGYRFTERLSRVRDAL